MAGRDDLNTGDMWNSNSLISWLIARSGIETTSIHPPAGGRAPGWQAGLVLAARQINRLSSPFGGEASFAVLRNRLLRGGFVGV